MILYNIIHSHIDSPYLLSELNYPLSCPQTQINLLCVYGKNTSYYNPITRMCRQHNEIIAGFPEIDIFNSSRYKFNTFTALRVF
jgi:hypothetical protein